MTQNKVVRRNELLKGMNLCLSGFIKDSDKKAELHRLIKDLGGTYMRDLMTTITTHLIMADEYCVATEKYREAVKTTGIEIVHCGWLEMCSSVNRLVPTQDFKVIAHSSQEVTGCNKDEMDPTLSSIHPISSLDKSDRSIILSHSSGRTKESMSPNRKIQDVCQHLLNANETDSVPLSLFSSCNFYFVGFNEGSLAFKNPMANTNAAAKSDATAEAKSLLYDLQQLVRKYMGTIFWTLDENNPITHMIVNTECCRNTELRYVYILGLTHLSCSIYPH